MADDVRPMTDKVQVMAPQQVEYTINIKYYCTKDDEAATIETIEGDGGAIDQYIAWRGTSTLTSSAVLCWLRPAAPGPSGWRSRALPSRSSRRPR